MREHLQRQVKHSVGPVQAKAIVSEPADAYELEADGIADEVLLQPDGHPSMWASLESRFGHDFRRIRVHADEAAADSAHALGARAYTVGPNIVFGAGQFAPETPAGRRLLAHELVHVLQQRAAPPSNGAALATSRASGIIQRQPASTPSGAAPTPADNIKNAIDLLRAVQPLFIHRALSAVPVNGRSVEVHRVDHLKGGKPVTSVFSLELKVAPLTGFSLALFQGSTVPKQGAAGTQTFAMTITVGDKAANFPPQTLARDLFHEGMHMQLFVDRAVPSWGSTMYLKGYEDYLATARKNANFAPLLAELTAFIKKSVKGTTQTVAADEAEQIIERIIEEKFVIDTTEQSSLGSKAAPPTGSARQQSYLSLTSRWLVTYLGQVGVGTMPPANIGSLAGKLMALWLDIDVNAPRPPRYPQPMGKHPELEPDILPRPLPAQPR